MFFFMLSSCYTVRSSLYFNNLYNSRRLVSEVVADGKTSKSVVEKLKYVDELLLYAASIDLNVRSAYKHYVEIEEDESVSYILQACKPYEFKPETWWFPIVGSVPYLGFFENSERAQKAKELTSAGMDIYLSEASAFSSLGWFEDPIYNSMLAYDTEVLTNIIFHELVHRTLWVADHVDFNEQLATYVADVMTHRYLKSKNLLPYLQSFQEKRRDRAQFAKWLESLKAELTLLYENPSVTDIKSQKQEILNKYETVLRPKFERVDLVGDEPWNNAKILAYTMYTPSQDMFEKAFVCQNQSVSLFLQELKNSVKKLGNPYLALENLCQGSGLL